MSLFFFGSSRDRILTSNYGIAFLTSEQKDINPAFADFETSQKRGVILPQQQKATGFISPVCTGLQSSEQKAEVIRNSGMVFLK